MDKNPKKSSSEKGKSKSALVVTPKSSIPTTTPDRFVAGATDTNFSDASSITAFSGSTKGSGMTNSATSSGSSVSEANINMSNNLFSPMTSDLSQLHKSKAPRRVNSRRVPPVNLEGKRLSKVPRTIIPNFGLGGKKKPSVYKSNPLKIKSLVRVPKTGVEHANLLPFIPKRYAKAYSELPPEIRPFVTGPDTPNDAKEAKEYMTKGYISRVEEAKKEFQEAHHALEEHKETKPTDSEVLKQVLYHRQQKWEIQEKQKYAIAYSNLCKINRQAKKKPVIPTKKEVYDFIAQEEAREALEEKEKESIEDVVDSEDSNDSCVVTMVMSKEGNVKVMNQGSTESDPYPTELGVLKKIFNKAYNSVTKAVKCKHREVKPSFVSKPVAMVEVFKREEVSARSAAGCTPSEMALPSIYDPSRPNMTKADIALQATDHEQVMMSRVLERNVNPDGSYPSIDDCYLTQHMKNIRAWAKEKRVEAAMEEDSMLMSGETYDDTEKEEDKKPAAVENKGIGKNEGVTELNQTNDPVDHRDDNDWGTPPSKSPTLEEYEGTVKRLRECVAEYKRQTGINLPKAAWELDRIHQHSFNCMDMWFYAGSCMPAVGMPWKYVHTGGEKQFNILFCVLPHPIFDYENTNRFLAIFDQGSYKEYRARFKYHFCPPDGITNTVGSEKWRGWPKEDPPSDEE